MLHLSRDISKHFAQLQRGTTERPPPPPLALQPQEQHEVTVGRNLEQTVDGEPLL